jgi:hypothetical protein
MRSAVLIFASILCGLSELAVAEDVGDLLSQLKACSQRDDAPRLECLNQLSRQIAQPPASSPAATNHWIVSETTSPVDYTPLVTATTSSRSDSERLPSLLSISCRNGRTELVVTNNGPPNRSANDFMVTYRINDQEPVPQRWMPAAGRGASFRGDVVSFLRSLPDQGKIGIRVFDTQVLLHDGIFLLDGLSIVRERVAAACKWPGAGAPTTRVETAPAQVRTLWKSER